MNKSTQITEITGAKRPVIQRHECSNEWTHLAGIENSCRAVIRDESGKVV